MSFRHVATGRRTRAICVFCRNYLSGRAASRRLAPVTAKTFSPSGERSVTPVLPPLPLAAPVTPVPSRGRIQAQGSAVGSIVHQMLPCAHMLPENTCLTGMGVILWADGAGDTTAAGSPEPSPQRTGRSGDQWPARPLRDTLSAGKKPSRSGKPRQWSTTRPEAGHRTTFHGSGTPGSHFIQEYSQDRIVGPLRWLESPVSE
jgi:hypothetical protein